MPNHDRHRPSLPVRLTLAERDFFMELRRLVDASGLSFEALEEATSDPRPESGESFFCSGAQWERWLNGQSLPPRIAVRILAEKLADHNGAGHLIDLWARAFVPTPYPQEPGRAPVRPRQLPASMQHFMGRTAELETLASLAEQVRASSAATVIVVEGTAGVGKTALAKRIGHAVADRFPDGQLYVSMPDVADASEPTSGDEVLRGFLEAFGIPHSQLPSAVDGQAALYRSLLAGKRVLVVLDNVRDAGQVGLLLPGAPGCLALVTSRNQLTGQFGDGTHVLRLNPFTMSEARDLLEHRLGSARVRRESPAADELIGLCARMPLALSVVAAHAAARPDFPLEMLADELRGHGPDLPDAGDTAITARTVFSASYHHLSDDAARMFRLLGVHAGPDISPTAGASLAAVPVEQARKSLDELARAYLVEEHLPGRFAFHDLLRAYAAERARMSETAVELEAALRRLLDYCLQSMHAGVTVAFPAGLPAPMPQPLPGVQAESFGSPAQALAWCHTERHAVQSLITHAAERGGFDAYCWRISWAMAPVLVRGGFLHDYLATGRIGLAAARNLGDPLSLGHAHYHLAHACALLGEVADSDAHLTRALRSFTTAGDQAAVAMTFNGMAQLLMQRGEYPRALEREQEALRLRVALGDQDEIAHSEQTIASIYARLGQHDLALRHCYRALDLSRETGIRLRTADALGVLGLVYLGLGDHDKAIAAYMEVLAIYRQAGQKVNIAEALTGLGDAQQAAGNITAARDSWQRALALLKDLPNADEHPVRARLAPRGPA
jgi:tetratricopeptide (TPR) repeat protein